LDRYGEGKWIGIYLWQAQRSEQDSECEDLTEAEDVENFPRVEFSELICT
jgi:hypothetical protein